MRLRILVFTLLFAAGCRAQDYNGWWQEVEQQNNDGKPKSALEIVEKIHNQAVKDKNSAQLIKSIIHQVKFNAYFEEESLVASIIRLEDEAEQAAEPTKQILYSLLAEMYWGYYGANSWQIHKRTASTESGGNILTWDFKRIVEEADKYYQLSLANSNVLKKATLDQYSEILEGSEKHRNLRPTLYHLLLSRALSFYSSEERQLLNFDKYGAFSNPALLGSRTEFLAIEIDDDEVVRPGENCIQLYQELLRESATVSDESKLLEDLKRLEFMYRRSQVADKDSLYEKSLRDLLEQHKQTALSVDIHHAIAELYHTQGSNASNPEHPDYWKWKDAVAICQKAIDDYPSAFAARNCISVRDRISMRNIGLEAESVILPKADFRFLLSYRNLGETDANTWPINVRIAQIDPIKYRESARSNYGEKRIKWILRNSETITETQFQVPNPGDYRDHSIELPLEGLSNGFYVILVGTDKQFSTNADAVGYATMSVSDIALLQRTQSSGSEELKVVSRNTGKPLMNARLELMELIYDRKKRSNHYEKETELITNNEGLAYWHKSSNVYRNLVVDVYFGDDQLISADNVNGRNYGSSDDRWHEQTHFFLDRAIYRPGQTIHFKGIMLKSKGKAVEAVADQETKVTLFDANGQEVSSLQLKSNGFGSFSGTFIAPTGGLNGTIRIGNENSSHSFKMEEYKRPKFEVKVNKPTEQFRINDTVSVVGTATSYAGVPLDGAEIKYRVTRTARFPFPWLCWGWAPRSNPKQVAFGSATSDADGNFTVTFQAQADPSIGSKYKPVFQYNIEVDVTDQSGEMQTGKTTVSVGYHALDLSIDLPEIIEKGDLGNYSVSATNLSGEKQPANVTVKVWTLKQNKRILRNRVWPMPDQFMLTEAEFIKKFHNEPYQDEHDYQTWEKDRNMLDTKLKTEVSDEVIFEALKSLDQGYYLVELTATDVFGTEVTQRNYFNLVDKGKTVPPLSGPSWFHVLKDSYEPGETVELLIGSSYAFVDYLVEVVVMGEAASSTKTIYSEKVSVTGTQKLISIPVTEEWRGGARITAIAVRNNELLSEEKAVSIPFTNKQLDVKLETFRKEMTPDDEEEWTLKISDKSGTPVKAELLATMYDASLDALAPNSWYLQPYPSLRYRDSWSSRSFGRTQTQVWDRNWKRYPSSTISREFEIINWYGHYFGGSYRGDIMLSAVQTRGRRRPNARHKFRPIDSPSFGDAEMDAVMVEETESAGEFNSDDSNEQGKAPEIKMRSDFAETVFFHPHLTTTTDGSVSIKFNAPQSLTKWKFMGLATTENVKIGTVTEEVVTRKQVMITPNYPRFVREGDELLYQVKVNVLDKNVLKGAASIEIKDALTGEKIGKDPVDRSLVFKNGTCVVSWKIQIPEGVSAIKITSKAWTLKHSDGEEKTIPVLSNRMLVTEAMPLPVRGKGTHSYSFDKLKDNNSASLRNHSLTLEFTPNPVWLAVLSLPYLMEYPYECSEQIFSRYYSNAIGTHLANSDPAIKRVFDQWKRDAQNNDGNAFLSELEKNPELKQALLTETPWVRDAQNETEQRQRIAELFDVERMKDEFNTSLKKLKQNQKGDGGWGWFNGMQSDMYITRYIVSGFGKMRKMGVWKMDAETQAMLQNAIEFLDEKMVEYYDRRALKDKDYQPNWTDLHMTYARSFWLDDFALKGKAKSTYSSIVKTIREKWTKLDAPQKGLAAVVLKRSGFSADADKVLVSLRETALHSEEFGTYWAMDKGYYWHQAPIENHVMILEAFHEVANDADMVREMNIWLLKQKQTQSWETTKATAEACYALLSTGNANFETRPMVSIQIGKETVDPRTDKDLKTEAGTGYFKTNWTKNSVTSDMGNVTVTKDNEGVAWGAVYWQYFEDLDKITGVTDNPIKMKRDVMLLADTEDGPVMKPLNENTSLSVGDRVRVKIVLETDRHMEYVHLKDMRAASFEPRKQLSGAEYQEGLSFYRSTTDAAMNFFFNYLPTGTFVFEYNLNVTQAGTFSNGISLLQCMYAPEFTTHSEGVRLNVLR